MLQEINNFTLQKHDGPYEKWPRKTDLYYDGKCLGKKVLGYVIEIQFESEDFYFLINSYNCPFEESSTFILINKNYEILEYKTLLRWYSSFVFEEYKCITDTELIVKYYGDFYVKINLFPNKQWFLGSRIKYTRCNGYT